MPRTTRTHDRLDCRVTTLIIQSHFELVLPLPRKSRLITALNEAAEEIPDLKECIKKVLGAIIVARRPLTQDDLDKLVLNEKDTSAQDILDKLGSVVEKYDDDNDEYDSDDDGDDETDTKSGGFIRLIHKSFDDFLTHQSLHHKDSWFINIEDHKRKLAQKYLSVLTNFLEKWTKDVKIPSHIQNYAWLGPLWHIECFDKSDVKDYVSFWKMSYLPSGLKS